MVPALVCCSTAAYGSSILLATIQNNLLSNFGKSSASFQAEDLYSFKLKAPFPPSNNGGLKVVAGRPRLPTGHRDAGASAQSPPLSGLGSAPFAGSSDASGSSGTLGPSSVATSAGETCVDELEVYRGLVLDTAYRPINVVCWKRALVLQILEKADVLQYYDQVVKSPTKVWPIPAVLRVSGFIHSPKEKRRKLSLSRNNIFLRDKFQCQYCGSKNELTIDHVKPISRGGGSSWENLVTACSPCNLKKGDKSPTDVGMKLMKKPREPKELDCNDLPPNYKTYRSLKVHSRTPAEWVDWLPLKRPEFY